MKKAVSVIVLMSLLTSMLTLAFNIQQVKSEPKTWVVDDDGPADFQTIQEAINMASPGDTIYVYNGTYYENVVLNKSLSLLGKDKDMTTIDANGTGTVIHVSANNVFIESLTIQNSGWPNAGISIDHSFNVSISEVSVSSNWGSGIGGSYSSNISITNSNLEKNGGGIHFTDSSNILIYKNNATNNGEGEGIRISGCSNVLISGNNANYNGFGIRLVRSASWRDCQNVSILGNNADYNQQTGISIHNSHNVSVLGNNANYNNDYLGAAGIGVYSSPNCFVSGNNSTKNYVGIYLSSSNCSVFGNNIEGNLHYDIKVTASGNRIFHNNLAKAVVSPSGLANTWDDGYPSGGNYWSNYTGVDIYSGPDQNMPGSDGIGDVVYEIDADNIDRYPLMGPFNRFDAGTWNGTAYNVDVVSNSTLSNFQLNTAQKTTSFNVTGMEETAGFCRITIPNIIVEDLWQGNYTVLLNGEPWPFTNWTDNENTYIYVNYTHSTHQITIIPEFPSALILPLFMILTMLAIIFTKKKATRRLKT